MRRSKSLIRMSGVLGLAAVTAMMATAALAEVEQASVARGGKLYDKWYKVIAVEAPAAPHALYPATNEKYAADPKANWRCKECHGWDGLGADGAYKEGSHATGIKGINGMIGGDPATVVALLKDPAHGYADKLSETDLTDIANFVVYGQIDWSLYVDAEAKASKGDATNGAQVYGTVCAGCHGADGKLPKDVILGSLSDNPWEVMQKILNGQPGEAMPGLRAIDHQISADLTAYLATLPKE